MSQTITIQVTNPDEEPVEFETTERRWVEPNDVDEEDKDDGTIPYAWRSAIDVPNEVLDALRVRADVGIVHDGQRYPADCIVRRQGNVETCAYLLMSKRQYRVWQEALIGSQR